MQMLHYILCPLISEIPSSHAVRARLQVHARVHAVLGWLLAGLGPGHPLAALQLRVSERDMLEVRARAPSFALG